MKKITSITMIALTVAVISTLFSCEEPVEGLGSNGILHVQVLSEVDYQPVPGAEVTIYRNVDDWAFEENVVKTVSTNQKGQFTLQALADGDYFLNVVSDGQDNWQRPEALYVNKGTVSTYQTYISHNLNSVISSVEGRSWKITKVTNEAGEDISSDENYGHWVNNELFFQKAGYFASDEGDPSTPTATEGSWWGWSTYILYILLNGTDIVEYSISDLESDSFTATYYENWEIPISLHFEKVN